MKIFFSHHTNNDPQNLQYYQAAQRDWNMATEKQIEGDNRAAGGATVTGYTVAGTEDQVELTNKV